MNVSAVGMFNTPLESSSTAVHNKRTYMYLHVANVCTMMGFSNTAGRLMSSDRSNSNLYNIVHCTRNSRTHVHVCNWNFIFGVLPSIVVSNCMVINSLLHRKRLVPKLSDLAWLKNSTKSQWFSPHGQFVFNTLDWSVFGSVLVMCLSCACHVTIGSVFIKVTYWPLIMGAQGALDE